MATLYTTNCPNFNKNHSMVDNLTKMLMSPPLSAINCSKLSVTILVDITPVNECDLK